MTSTTDTDYRPISCDVHSQYELAIVQRRRLQLTWVEGNVTYNQPVLPTDLQTVNHEEFLVCRLASGEQRRIRLDHIHAWTPA